MTSQTTTVKKERVYFHAPVGKFNFYGEAVWRGNGEVAANSGFTLEGFDLSDNCEFSVEFTRMDKSGRSFGNVEERQCPAKKSAPSWPKASVQFGINDSIAAVKVVAKVDNEPVFTFICPRLAECEQIS